MTRFICNILLLIAICTSSGCNIAKTVHRPFAEMQSDEIEDPELTRLAEYINTEAFEGKLKFKIYWMTDSYRSGLCYPGFGLGPAIIYINKNANYSEINLEQIIVHELTHEFIGITYKEHSPAFIKKCKEASAKLGVNPTCAEY